MSLYKQFDKAELEKQYSPSSCIEDISPFIQQYIKFSKKSKKLAQKNNTLSANLSYASRRSLAHQINDELIDLYQPFPKKPFCSNKKNSAKCMIYIHGGYWQELTKNESSFAATNFQEHDCFFAVINYSLAPNATLTEIVEQNRRAIAWLYEHAENLGFDPKEIYLSGSSAGAHLVMIMLQTNWQNYIQDLPENKLIKGVCAVSGVYDLSPIQYTYINDPLQLTVQEISELSPLNQQNQIDCPVIFAIGQNETSEFKRQTNLMHEHLHSQNIPISFAEIPQRNHFDVIVDLANPQSRLCKMVFQLMGLQPKCKR